MPKVLFFIVFMAFSRLGAMNNTTILATPYFVYCITWLGNTLAIIDLTGWTIDWIAAWWYYLKGDSPEVAGLRNQLKALQKGDIDAQEEQLAAVANICDMIIEYLRSENIDSENEKQEVIRCIKLAQDILVEEAKLEAHVAIGI